MTLPRGKKRRENDLCNSEEESNLADAETGGQDGRHRIFVLTKLLLNAVGI